MPFHVFHYSQAWLYMCVFFHRHRWVWEEPSAVPWRWLCKHGGQLPVCVPRRTRDCARWVGLSRWVMRSSERRLKLTLLLQTFLLVLAFLLSLRNCGRMQFLQRDERKTKRVKRWSVGPDAVTEETVWMTSELWIIPLHLPLFLPLCVGSLGLCVGVWVWMCVWGI